MRITQKCGISNDPRLLKNTSESACMGLELLWEPPNQKAVVSFDVKEWNFIYWSLADTWHFSAIKNAGVWCLELGILYLGFGIGDMGYGV